MTLVSRMLVVAACVLGVTALCGACTTAAPDVDPKGPFGAPTETTVFHYKSATSTGAVLDIAAAVTGEQTVAGESFPVYTVGTSNGGTAFLRQTGAHTYRFAGGSIFSSKLSADPTQPYVSGTLDAPIDFTLKPEVGKSVSVTLAGTMNRPGSSTPEHMTLTGSYKLEDTSATVETAAGTINGCSYFTGSSELFGITVTGELWYHNQFGVVGIKVPAYNLNASFIGTEDMGDSNDELNVIRKMAVLTAESPHLSLNSFDRKQLFDADNMQHAKMLLELRYADETAAKSSVKPSVTQDFGTVWGSFNYAVNWVSSPVSLFHPQDNGKGMTFWYAFVDQAAKNEMGDSTAYHITADLQSGEQPVRATARIIYHLIPEAIGQ